MYVGKKDIFSAFVIANDLILKADFEGDGGLYSNKELTGGKPYTAEQLQQSIPYYAFVDGFTGRISRNTKKPRVHGQPQSKVNGYGKCTEILLAANQKAEEQNPELVFDVGFKSFLVSIGEKLDSADPWTIYDRHYQRGKDAAGQPKYDEVVYKAPKKRPGNSKSGGNPTLKFPGVE